MKKPLSDEQFAKLAKQLRDSDATRLGTHPDRGPAIAKYAVGDRANGRLFRHLAPEVAKLAKAKLNVYLGRHKVKIAKMEPLKRARYFARLCACASAHAQHPSWLGGKTARSLKGSKGYKNSIRRKLGLMPDWDEWPRRLEHAANVHASHGQPVAAGGSTDMTGV